MVSTPPDLDFACPQANKRTNPVENLKIAGTLLLIVTVSRIYPTNHIKQKLCWSGLSIVLHLSRPCPSALILRNSEFTSINTLHSLNVLALTFSLEGVIRGRQRLV